MSLKPDGPSLNLADNSSLEFAAMRQRPGVDTNPQLPQI